MVGMLRETVRSKNKTIEKEREKQKELVFQNKLLGYRSKELTRLKVKPYISKRSMYLVDSAVYSDFFGYVDSVILDTAVKIIRIEDLNLSKRCLYQGNFRDIYKHTLRNGEVVVLKEVNRKFNFPEEKCLSILSVELRIKRIVNIVDYHGLLLWNDRCFLVQSCESNHSLKKFFVDEDSKETLVLSSILKGIGAALTHMHNTGIVNNNIREENILLRYYNNCMSCSPVLMSLSLACRADSCKPLTIAQQKTYENFFHIPSCVLKGLTSPSIFSDRFSMSFIVADIMKCLPRGDFSSHNKLDLFWRKCYKMDSNISIEDFDTDLLDCCYILDK